MKFSSTEDLDDIDAASSKNTSNDNDKSEDTKSYTNTVNSKEFREYLNKHGLVLFPVKTSVDSTGKRETVNLKKKTMMKRLSSMFTRSKMPYSSENEKTYVVDKKPDQNRYFYANSSGSSEMKNNARSNVFKKNLATDDDWKSSISSVLSAADTEDYLSSPVGLTRETKPTTGFQRNELYQTMPHSYYRPSNYRMSTSAINGHKTLDKQNYESKNPRRRQVMVANNHHLQSPIDPFTFAKIHQIKKHTDDNFLKEKFEPQYYKIPQQNCNFNRKNTLQSNSLQHIEYHNNLNSCESPRSSLVSPSKEVSREEVMNKIYEYYRKSVNSTPVQIHSKDNCYSTLPNRSAKLYQANGFNRISNPIQQQQKIYDEVRHSASRIPVQHDHARQSTNISIEKNLGNKNTPVTSTPRDVELRTANDKSLSQVSPKKNHLSQRSGSLVFRPIAELCSKIFTDPRTPRKNKIRAHTQSSHNKKGNYF